MVAVGSLERGASEGHCVAERNSDGPEERMRKRYGKESLSTQKFGYRVRGVVGREAPTSGMQ